jgi:hypothetical protein
MRAVIIVDAGTNPSLLKFTETKLFFDSNNQYRELVDDCFVAPTTNAAVELANTLVDFSTIFIIQSGYFLTSYFLNTVKLWPRVNIIKETDPGVIIYDSDTYIGFDHRCKYEPESKQLYIVENMLRAVLVAKKSVYLENTEPVTTAADIAGVKHLFGLASGWKTLHLANTIGFENLRSITVYDFNPIQLEYAKDLHASATIPTIIKEYKNSIGHYQVPIWINQELWQKWHNYPVEFKIIDLFKTPVFPPNSLVWISNVFKFEPTIFQYGWQAVKEAREKLHNANKDSIIITTS